MFLARSKFHERRPRDLTGLAVAPVVVILAAESVRHRVLGPNM